VIAPPPTGLAHQIASGDVSSTDATRIYLDRIEWLDGLVGAFITVDAEGALAQARAADETLVAGSPLGPLHGVPVALKDNIDTAGLRTTVGSAYFADRVPDVDAEVTSRLRNAGAVVVGKVTMHEFAYGATNQNPHFGPCRNPWDLSRVPGGSSGGSGAAVAADFCAVALGTDTGGSVRIPAALNGVSAVRPSHGRVSNRGVFPITWSFDTVGPIARAVTDLAPVVDVLAGYDADDPHSVDAPTASCSDALEQGVEGLRIGIPRNFFFDDVDADIVHRVRAAAEVFAGLGAELEEIDLPGAESAVDVATTIIRSESFAIHRARLADQPDRFGEDVRRRLLLGEAIAAADYAACRQEGRVWRRTVDRAFERLDLILAPSSGTTAPPADSEMIETTQRLVRLTYAWSLAGLPAMSVPCGFSDSGMPIGVQLAAARFREPTLCRAGAAYQRVTDWHLHAPSFTSSKGET
jgi:aspartyl-tRNA(Asn)/glutamyl-tRNA(Gln) amidotransferase subunit A